MRRTVRRRAAGTLAACLIGGSAAASFGCSLPQPPCSDASSCPCPSAPADGPAPHLVFAMREGDQTAAAALQRLAANPQAVRTLLQLRDVPLVQLETYDELGQLRDHGSFALGGVGTSALRAEADAKLEAQCLQRAATTLSATPQPGEPGNLLRALPQAGALAAGPGSRPGGAVLATGFGLSVIEQTPVAKIDLTSAASRDHATAELGRVGLLPDSPSSTPVYFLDPGAGVANGIAASDITEWVDSSLCPALSTACRTVKVLP